MASKSVGVNVEYDVNAKNILKLEIDLNKENGLSGSGKTIVIGSTKGNQRIKDSKGNEVVIGVNVYKYPSD